MGRTQANPVCRNGTRQVRTRARRTSTKSFCFTPPLPASGSGPHRRLLGRAPPCSYVTDASSRCYKTVVRIHLSALAGVAQWIEWWPENQRIASLIPNQAHERQSHIDVSFLFLPPFPLSLIQIKSSKIHSVWRHSVFLLRASLK